MKHFVFLFYLLTAAPVFAQTLQTLTANNKVSIRGLSVVDDRIIWVSGSGGAVAKSLDSGKSWLWMTVKGFEKRDFRDIAAFDAKTAIIMAVAEPAVLLKTTDGGASWRMVFTDSSSGMFLDAMDFRDKDHGAVIGDPINKKLYLVSTADGGDHWTKPTGSALPFLGDGEAFFAASGTNLQYVPGSGASFGFVSGGKKSRLWIYKSAFVSDSLPLDQGKESTGANSIAFFNDQRGIVVGGDFARDTSGANNCVLFQLGDKVIFTKPIQGPHGYRSCVRILDGNRLICCGTTGVDLSSDGGKTWQLISGDGYHVCMLARAGKSVFLAGSNGRIAKLNW